MSLALVGATGAYSHLDRAAREIAVKARKTDVRILLRFWVTLPKSGRLYFSAMAGSTMGIGKVDVAHAPSGRLNKKPNSASHQLSHTLSQYDACSMTAKESLQFDEV